VGRWWEKCSGCCNFNTLAAILQLFIPTMISSSALADVSHASLQAAKSSVCNTTHMHGPHLDHGPLSFAIPTAAVGLHVMPCQLHDENGIQGFLIGRLCLQLTTCVPVSKGLSMQRQTFCKTTSAAFNTAYYQEEQDMEEIRHSTRRSAVGECGRYCSTMQIVMIGTSSDIASAP